MRFMLDLQPLSDAEIDDRLRAALDALGTARGKTAFGHRILQGARMLLSGSIRALLRATTPTADLWPAKRKPERD